MKVQELLHGLLKADPNAFVILPVANPEGGDDLELPLTSVRQRAEDENTVVELFNPGAQHGERPMTVKELAATLQTYDQDAEAVLLHEDVEEGEMKAFELTMVHQNRKGDQVWVELFNPMACGY